MTPAFGSVAIPASVRGPDCATRMAQFRELRRNGATDARQLRHESSETPTPELQPMAAGSDLPARYLASDPDRQLFFPFSTVIASMTSNTGRKPTAGRRSACSGSSKRPFGIHSTDRESPSGYGESWPVAGRAGSTMNIASSTWWMTTASTSSQRAVTTENRGTPPWNQGVRCRPAPVNRSFTR